MNYSKTSDLITESFRKYNKTQYIFSPTSPKGVQAALPP